MISVSGEGRPRLGNATYGRRREGRIAIQGEGGGIGRLDGRWLGFGKGRGEFLAGRGGRERDGARA